MGYFDLLGQGTGSYQLSVTGWFRKFEDSSFNWELATVTGNSQLSVASE